MPVVRTRYTLLQRDGREPGTFQSFELARDTQTGATTLVALDIFSVDRTHYDLSNAGVVTSGTKVVVGGTANGVEFVAPRATYDFVLTFDLNDPTYATFDGRTAIRLDVAVVTGDTPAIDATYYDLLGRLPNGSELDYWNPRFGNGSADVSVLRHAIVDDASAGAGVRSTIDKLYVEFGGRGASTAELAFWSARLADGEHYSGVRTAIIDDMLGRNHIATVTNAFYEEFAGRRASAAEAAFWINEVRGGTTYVGIRNAILDDSLGKDHTKAELGTLYREYFGRTPDVNEVAVWDGFLHRGHDFDTVAVTLALDHGSDDAVRRFTGTYQADVFDFGPRVGHAVVSDFDWHADRIRLGGTDVAGIDPLDDVHARNVFEVNGAGHGVLVTLGDHDMIFIRDVYLWQLRESHVFI